MPATATTRGRCSATERAQPLAALAQLGRGQLRRLAVARRTRLVIPMPRASEVVAVGVGHARGRGRSSRSITPPRSSAG